MPKHSDEPIVAPERQSRSLERCLEDVPTLERDQVDQPERMVPRPVQKLEQSPVLARPEPRTRPSIQPVLDEQNRPTIPPTIPPRNLRMTRHWIHLKSLRLNLRNCRR